MGRSQWWLRNLCCSLLSHQQHSYPGWINPSTAFFAHGRLMWFQQLQTQETSKLLEVEKAEPPLLWVPRTAAGWPGSALQDQRCTHTKSFCSPALQFGSTWSVFPRGQDCWEPSRVVRTVLQRDWRSVHRRVAAGRNDSDMHALAPLKWMAMLKPKPLLTAPH